MKKLGSVLGITTGVLLVACGGATGPANNLIRGNWGGALDEGSVLFNVASVDSSGKITGTGTITLGGTDTDLEIGGSINHPSVILNLVQLPFRRDTIRFIGEFDGDDVINRLGAGGNLTRR